MATKNQTNQESVIMKQYANLKAKYADALLLFRCGNFYEVYEEDAKAAADVLGITLVSESDITKAVFPYHALDTYLPMLIRAGKRVAICDQIEAPKQPKSKTTTENKNTETKTTNTETTMTTTKNTTTEIMNVQPAQVENTTEQIVSMGNDLPEVKFATYTTKKGATAPQIIGFADENDPRWKAIHDNKPKWASACWVKDITGKRVYRLIFGVRYMEVAKALCEAYNTNDRTAWATAEQACEDCYHQAQADGKARYEAIKAERAAKRSSTTTTPTAASEQPAGKSYTEQEVAALMQRVLKGDAAAMAEVNAMMQKVA